MTTEYGDVDAEALKQVVLERLDLLKDELADQSGHVGGALSRRDWLNAAQRITGVMLQEARISEVRGLLQTARYRGMQGQGTTIKVLKKGK
jgi:hypothetical protein